ncbi:MAG: Leucine-rich repeat (LRR) protein, partial [Planctomycetaceae bacterium]
MARDEAYRKAEKKIEEARRARAIGLDLSSLGQYGGLGRENVTLKKLPASLVQLTNLKTLSLSDNQMTTLPESLLQLWQLQTLNFSNNQLTTLPTSFVQLTQLRKLNLSHNQFTVLPQVLVQLTQVQTLDLTYNRLTSLPDTLGQLSHLKQLNLSCNRLSTLPTAIRQLRHLTTLDLNGNELTAVPDPVTQLTQLQNLDVSHNKLDALPTSLGNLTQLQELSVSGNRLTTLPQSLSNLIQLENLLLGVPAGGNPLGSVPACIRSLRNLKWINLTQCSLDELPSWFGDLSVLSEIYLQDNKLTDLPGEIGLLPNLQRLDLRGNPLNPELAAADEQGLEAVKAYLRAKAEDQIVLNEAKLILIGEGDVGKSCLLDALRDEPFHKHPSTHGIEIKPVRVTHSGNDGSETDISLNTWDFGGQKVYRPTHQMFFTAPAVYLVVWKPREGPQQGAVEFWIETILSRAGNDARILVIATHGGPGQRLPDLAQQELRDRFGNSIVGFLSVDSQPEGYDKDDESTWDGPRKGIEELKSRIAEIAAGLPAMGREVPASWKSVLTALQERGKDTPWIKYKDFQNLCRPRKVSHELAATYAGMLKTLGYIIHYGQDGEDNDQGLGQYMILRPDYLAKAISFVLDDQTTRDQHGLITHERLSSLWSDPPYNYEFGYPEEIHELFRKLMEQFDLSYEVAHDPAAQDPKPTSLIAQLVDENPPKLPDWSDIPLEAEDEKKQICQIVEKDGDKSQRGREVSLLNLQYFGEELIVPSGALPLSF